MRAHLLLALAALTAAACTRAPETPRTVQPGAPGHPAAEVAAGSAGAEGAPHTAADVAFVQAMIPHHAQALVMARLVPERTSSERIRLLAERIIASQRAEIARMRRWLSARGEAVPTEAEGGAGNPEHAGHGAAAMHGMASPAELARLEAARGPAFDRLFLELMIRHHEGALAMTRDLLEIPGSGLEPELFQLISHIDADQRAEIARMRRLLDSLQ